MSSQFEQIGAEALRAISQRVEMLSKSISAGYPGLSSAGKTGMAAISNEQLDPVLRSITMEERDFYLTKDIPVIKATQSVYMYNVKTAVGQNVDVAGLEAFLPQQSSSQYMRVGEVLKVYGIRKSITQMAQFINDESGYSVDIEKENDTNAALEMAQAMERDSYIGGDYYIAQDGSIDFLLAANQMYQFVIRKVRGIQAQIREGNSTARGIPGDFIGYGNNRSVVFNLNGDVLNRSFLDKVVTAVKDSRGRIKEGHCTTSQLAEFRSTFFAFERADLNIAYAIRGAGIQNEEKEGFPIDTVGGSIDFIPNVFKYMRQTAIPLSAGNGIMPQFITTVGAPAASGSVVGSGFLAGEIYTWVFQTVNIVGMQVGQASSSYTVAGPDANKAVTVALTLPAGSNINEIFVFRTPKEAAGDSTKAMFIGKMAILPNQTSATFVDNNAVIPGLDSVVFMPRDKNRAKMAVLKNLMTKMDLGVSGTAFETVYTSYWCLVVDRPRSFSVVDNVFQDRTLLDS